MTDHDDHHDHHDQVDANDAHALSGAYAVDALDDLERARFEAHLRGCPDCRAEVDGLRETAAALAAEPVAPPPGLRAAVLAGIDEIRPLPPLPDADPAPLETSRVERRRPWFLGTGPLLVAAAIVLVALVSTVWLQPWEQDEPEVTLTTTERVLTDPDAEHVRHQLEDGSSVTVVVSSSEGRAVVLTDDMAPAPEGKDFQLWLQSPTGELEPAGLMPDDPDATVLLDGDPTDATGLGITVEPDGGSKEPNLPPLEFIDLST